MPAHRRTGDRIGWALLSLACAGVLVAARLVTPSPAGHGTHEQLGLPPCTFQMLTGHGCPGCGMTTSFAHLARGDVALAFSVNPLGPIFFGLAALLAPVFGLLAFRGDSMDEVLQNRYILWAPLVAFALMVLVWLVRLALGQV